MGSNPIYYLNEMCVLRIYYNESEYLRLVLTQKATSFQYPALADEDATEYESILQDFKKQVIEMNNNKVALLIYSNPNFNKPLTESKYKEMVTNFITEHGKAWSDITEIIKMSECIEIDYSEYLKLKEV